MSQTKFDEDLLEAKRKKFFETVYRICQKRNLQMPDINFGGCSEEEGNDSHYHPDTHTICISKKQLDRMDLERVRDVAVHEASHIRERNHKLSFIEEEASNAISVFEVPGVVHITPTKQKKGKEKRHVNKIDKTRCNYHLCRKVRKLIRCSYCRNYYCGEHKNPFEPAMYSMDRHSTKISGHPCAGYADHLIKKKKKTDKKYAEALANIIKKR